MQSAQRNTIMGLVVVSCLASATLAATRKEYRFTVSPGANISVDTQYGAISVKPGAANQAVVVALLQSDKAEVDSLQKGNRIAIESHLLPGADHQSGRVDYELTVPPDATVSLRSSTGPLSAEHLQGDLSFEGTAAAVDVRSVSHGHVHVKTISGPVTLTDVHEGHVEITSLSGDIHLNQVSGPLVQVDSNSGKIYYDGDFGSGGDYSFVTHTGDIEALVPSYASADFRAHTVRGSVQDDVVLQPQTRHSSFDAARSFMGTVGKAASEVVLRSFSGKIRLKQR